MTVLCVVNDDDLGREVLRAGQQAATALGTRTVVAAVRGDRPDAEFGLETVTLPEHQDEADAVVDLSIETKAALIVVGVRRRSPVGKFLLGSAAQRIILEAEVPVLTVKEPLHD